MQIRVKCTVTSVTPKHSGGEYTQAHCHVMDNSKHLNFKQRIAVVKVVNSNPTVTGNNLRLALQQLSTSGKVKPSLAQ
jgi:hypothetical protein